MAGWAEGKTAARGPGLIVGTGRSGTHLLARALSSNPELRVTIETPPMFELATRMALDQGCREALLPCLVAEYERQQAISAPQLYVDKSHPNLWIAEELARALPHAQFLGIYRDPFATVASMLGHAGVMAWHERWREFAVPNAFLGITPENIEEYEGLPAAAKCALRWRSHHQQLTLLKRTLGPRLMVVRYEDLVTDTEGRLREVSSFLGLYSSVAFSQVQRESLEKWRAQLSEEEIAQIAAQLEG